MKGATLTDASRLARAWFALALFALGVSALLAIVLVAARTPIFGLAGLGSGFFRTALVMHVNLGVLVWFLSAAAGAWTLLRARCDTLGWGALLLATAGVAAMLAAPVLGGAPPVLANYVPVLDSPLFLAGLSCVLVAVLGTGLLSATAGRERPLMLFQSAVRWAVLTMAVAAMAFVIDQSRADGTALPLPATLDERLWGAGHLLQFVHVLMMMAASTLLGQRFLAETHQFARLVPWLLAATALATLGGVYFSLREVLGSAAHREAYTGLMRWATWPGPLLLGAGLSFGAWRVRRTGLHVSEYGLLASLALYAIGCLAGTIIQNQATTSVPAHYHGTVGAVTLAYLVVAIRHAGNLGLAIGAGRWLNRLPLLYGMGVSSLVSGLGWLGLQGVLRKVPHTELVSGDAAHLTAMTLAGVGGFLALAAILLLVSRFFLALRRSLRSPGGKPPYRDVRFRALAITSTVVLVGGLVLEFVPAIPSVGAMTAEGHVAEKKRAEIDLRFSQGVVMLHAKEFKHALTAFHRVIELAPQMPEAYVNTGFALLGLGRPAAARDFFDEATNLRRDQVNGYYGLALALDEMGDTFGAMQAMEAYLHRAPAGDPYRRKAEAAVWEWRAQLDRQKVAAVMNTSPLKNASAASRGHPAGTP